MRYLRHLIYVSLTLLLLVACGGESVKLIADNTVEDSTGSAAAEIGAAQAQLMPQSRRVAIVHSKASRDNFYDGFAYNQLFASVQNQSMMAGMPFDLLDETALATTANLLEYDAIIIPAMSHVKSANRDLIKQRLLAAQLGGVGIITSGEFMIAGADGVALTDSGSAMVEVLGVTPEIYLSGVGASVQVANTTHPVNQTYTANEVLTSYFQLWFASFAASPGELSTPLTVIKAEGSSYTGAQIVERTGREGKVVHFANEQVMADNNQLWRVIQWMVYGDLAPVTLQLSRSDHVFIARNDMDQAMIAAELNLTEIPLLEMIKDWKRDYNFVGSYYLDIGNDPANGQYTDWGISAPLYQEYIALGNEIGTHSWTHPHFTSQLNATELEFEFEDSAEKIATEIGMPVTGAAIPGNAESLFVVETLNPWFDYLSGRTGSVGSGYPGAFGYLEPQHDMMYFSLNLSPDFTLIDFLRQTPAQATTIWKNEIDGVLKHAQQPLVHWLWHDYGPTTQTAAGLYTVEMFTDTLAYAKSLNAEFATLDDIHNRIDTFSGAEISVGKNGVISASVGADAVGQFALKVTEGLTIKNVTNWYAYDEDQVFLAEGGGDYNITVGAVADAVTRISALPMRAKLLALSGDGNQLNFSIQGEGNVEVVLSPEMIANNMVSGASSFIEENGILTLQFDSAGIHNVEIVSSGSQADINYEYFEGSWQNIPDFDALTPRLTGVLDEFTTDPKLQSQLYGFRYTTTFYVPVAEVYTFYVRSDDGSRLFVDGQRVVNNDGLHGSRERQGTINLSAGQHDIVLEFFQRTGRVALEVQFETASQSKQTLIPSKEPVPVPEPRPVPTPTPVPEPAPLPEPTPVPEPAPVPNLITNGDFENGISSWFSCGGDQLIAASGVASSNAINLTNAGCLFNEFGLTSGALHALSCQALVEGDYASATLSFLDNNFQVLASQEVPVTSSTFSTVQAAVTAPVNASVGVVTLYGDTDATFDNCRVVATGGTLPVAPEAPAPVDPADNLLLDGDFTEGYAAATPGWLSCGGETSTDGELVLGALGCSYQEFTVSTEREYALSCSGSAVGYSSMQLSFVDQNFVVLASTEALVPGSATSTLSASEIAPAGTALGVVTLYADQSATFDNCAVVEL